MKQSTRGLRFINVAMVLALCAAATFGQGPSELDSTARERIEQARASIVMVEAVDQSNERSPRRLVFYPQRSDRTDIELSTETRAIVAKQSIEQHIKHVGSN